MVVDKAIVNEGETIYSWLWSSSTELNWTTRRCRNNVSRVCSSQFLIWMTVLNDHFAFFSLWEPKLPDVGFIFVSACIETSGNLVWYPITEITQWLERGSDHSWLYPLLTTVSFHMQWNIYNGIFQWIQKNVANFSVISNFNGWYRFRDNIGTSEIWIREATIGLKVVVFSHWYGFFSLSQCNLNIHFLSSLSRIQ